MEEVSEEFFELELKVADELDQEMEKHDELVQKVLRGELGRGDDRRLALGEKYDSVMREVKRIRLQNGNS